MAWSTPSTRTTGTLITAAIWNSDVVNNPIALKADKVEILHIECNVSGGSASYEDVVTYTLPGGTIGADEALFFFAQGNTNNAGVAGNDANWRITYGGTAFPATSLDMPNTGWNYGNTIWGNLFNNGATNVQGGGSSGLICRSINNLAPFTQMTYHDSTGTAAIDSTVNQTFKLQLSVNHASNTYDLHYFILMKVGN